MDFHFTYRPVDEVSAREFLQWKYDPPYELYNYSPVNFESDLAYHLDPDNNIFSIYKDEELVGYCSFGQDARVRGGDYSVQALDIGLMIKPSLTGQGLGSDYVKNIIHYAIREFQASKLRVTILESNLRAQRVWEKNGFHKTSSFRRATDQLRFVILIKDV